VTKIIVETIGTVENGSIVMTGTIIIGGEKIAGIVTTGAGNAVETEAVIAICVAIAMDFRIENTVKTDAIIVVINSFWAGSRFPARLNG
jgi:hypothetical protein